MKNKESGFVKEIVIIIITILILGYLNIDINDASNFIKNIFYYIKELIN